MYATTRSSFVKKRTLPSHDIPITEVRDIEHFIQYLKMIIMKPLCCCPNLTCDHEQIKLQCTINRYHIDYKLITFFQLKDIQITSK